MRGNKRSRKLLVLSVVSLAALIYIIFSLSPIQQFTILPVFFSLLFVTIFSFTSFLFNDLRKGVIVGIACVLYLLLRMNNLTHPFFLILLIGIVIAIELLFRKK